MSIKINSEYSSSQYLKLLKGNVSIRKCIKKQIDRLLCKIQIADSTKIFTNYDLTSLVSTSIEYEAVHSSVTIASNSIEVCIRILHKKYSNFVGKATLPFPGPLYQISIT